MVQKQETKEFIKLCMQAPDEATLLALFELFFTPEEKIDLGKRYLIIQALLKDDQPQRAMAQDLAVSIAKITRGSNELKRIDDKLLKFLEKHMVKSHAS
jgi:TrpR family trp operon transcriptional repressor